MLAGVKRKKVITEEVLKLYRGFDRRIPSGEYENPFVDTPRIPKDTPLAIHEYADDWFHEQFGIRARSTTIICSTDLVQAQQYGDSGTVAEITPLQEFSLIYSTQVRDFLDVMVELSNISASSVATWLESKAYRCVNSCSMLPQGFRGEVLVSCSRYKLSAI